MENGSKKIFYQKWWLWIIIGVVIIGIITVIGVNSTKSNTKAGSTKLASTAAKTINKKEEAAKITYANFIKIQMGSKYDSAVAILGEGKELSSSEKNGVNTSSYTWNEEGAGIISVTVQNGVITGKEQVGLNSNNSNITLSKYNKIKEGMSYDEVRQIAGEGQIISQSKITDIEIVVFTYTWVNKDGSNMKATFSGGKLCSKTQSNLK